VTRVNRVALPLLKGIDRSRDTLIDNTARFAAGLPANNALLLAGRARARKRALA
jgi:predicted AAA+ superfamily ATPase